MSPVKGEPSSPKQSPTSSSASTVAPKRQAVTARSTKARDKEEETKTAPTTAKRKPTAHHRYSSGSVLLDLVVGGGLGEGYAPGKLINIVGDKSSGKAQPLDSLVLTPSGFRRMGDIKIGDKVVVIDGSSVDVIGVYPQGKQPVYEFTFSDGSVVRSASSHLWRVQSPNQFHSDTMFGMGQGFCLVTTEQIAQHAERGGLLHGGGALYFPAHAPVVFERQEDLPLDPYLLGFLIAEGCLGYSTSSFSSSERDRIECIAKIVDKYGCKLSGPRSKVDYNIVNKQRNNRITYISEKILELGLRCKSIEKFIPEFYLHSSIEDRQQLLRGLFDGDGYVTKGSLFDITISCEQLAKDIQYLVRSLGGTASLRNAQSFYIGKNNKRVYCEIAWTVMMKFVNFLPFTSVKHEGRYQAVRKNHSWCVNKLLREVCYIGEEDCQCIYVSHPQHCYITDGFTVTHNTLLACEIIAAAYNQHGTRLRWVYDDCESGFTFNTQQLYGVEIMPQDEDERTKSGTVEQAYCNVRAFLESLNPGQPGIYVIDSLDGLTSKEQDDRADERFSAFKRGKDLDKGSYQMGKAKYLSQEFFPQLSDLLQDKAALLIIISQTRDKIDSLFKEQTRSGGKAMDFYAHTVLWLSVITKYKKLGRVTGIGVKAHAKKSKTPRPFRFCDLSLLFDYGLDNVGSALDYLFSLRGKDGQLLQSASRIMWEGEELTVQGLRALLKPLAHPTEADVDMYGWIKEHVSPKFNLEEIREWLDLQDQKDGGDRAERAAIQALCKDRFGVSTTRAELIQKAEEDPAFQAVLLDRVRKQWEAEEEKVRSGRQPKYGRTSG